jgi:putative transposase
MWFSKCIICVLTTYTPNIVYKRQGGLFQKPFRRLEVKELSHLHHALIYVHVNAQKHGIVDDFRNYSFCSYEEIIAGKSDMVNVKAVLHFFGGRQKFIEAHQHQLRQYKGGRSWPSSKLED